MRLIDSLLARRIEEGDVLAFENFIKKYKDKIFNHAFHLINDYQIAEEITQDAFVKAYQKISLYDSKKSSLSTWIMTIAHNESINKLRTKKNELPLEEQYLLISPRQSPEQRLLRGEAMKSLIEILDTLSFKEKSIILLKDYSGYKLKEISQMLNIPEGTVKSTLHGARNKVRERLGEVYDQ